MGEGRFAGKVAFVTGVASGIGRATAIRLTSEGATVVGADVHAERLAAVTDEIAAAGGRFSPTVLDVSDRGACRDAIESCVAEHGALHVLGNIAGIVHVDHFTEVTEADYRRVLAINVDGPFFLTQAAMPHLLESGGNVVSIASNSAVSGVAYLVPYSMTKAAIVQMTKSLAMEYIRTGVRINAIAPGGTETNIAEHMAVPEGVDMEIFARMSGLRGYNTAEEVAALFAFVASDEAPGIHGAVLGIDNGVTVG